MKVIPSSRRKSFQERRYLNRVTRAPVIHTVGIHVYPNATQVIRQEVINDYVNLFKNNFSKNILQRTFFKFTKKYHDIKYTCKKGWSKFYNYLLQPC